MNRAGGGCPKSPLEPCPLHLPDPCPGGRAYREDHTAFKTEITGIPLSDSRKRRGKGRAAPGEVPVVNVDRPSSGLRGTFVFFVLFFFLLFLVFRFLVFQFFFFWFFFLFCFVFFLQFFSMI
jgi:hypothetical protein